VSEILRTRAATIAWWTCLVALLVTQAGWAVRKTTWYLAVDQYGYLTFAGDLARGRVFHEWPPASALAAALPTRADVMSQTYVWDDGRLYSRYAPGYPLLLAAAIRLFGADAPYSVNVVALVLVLATVLVLHRRLAHDRWYALAALALLLSLPTMVTRWALTPLRDLAAHLVALLGIAALVPRRRLRLPRLLASGAAIGFAMSIRQDAALYLVPAGLAIAVASRSVRPRPGLLGATLAGLVLGLAPLLAYNATATGNPLSSTQGMEATSFWSSQPKPTDGGAGPRVGEAGPRWQGGTAQPVEGGGLRIAHLAQTLPQAVTFLRRTHSDLLLALALLGALLALAGRRRLFVVCVPYVLVALVFYGCWVRFEPRYLTGVVLLVPMLVIEGLRALPVVVRRLARRLGRVAGVGVAAVVSSGLLFVTFAGSWAVANAGPRLVALAAAAAMLAAATRHRTRWIAVPLALALTGRTLWQLGSEIHDPARFGKPAARQARATLARLVGPGSVVIASEDVGRPAENIDHYADGVSAFYLTDLERWHLPIADAVSRLQVAGLRPYLLLPRSPAVGALVDDLAPRVSADLLAEIPASDAVRYFVATQGNREPPLLLFRLRTVDGTPAAPTVPTPRSPSGTS
jgi:4-amino-4-deoxy-L-arabinose transferase-like glycosyltransferase